MYWGYSITRYHIPWLQIHHNYLLHHYAWMLLLQQDIHKICSQTQVHQYIQYVLVTISDDETFSDTYDYKYWGDSHLKRSCILVGNVCFDPQEVLKRAWFRFFRPLKGTKKGSIRIRKRTCCVMRALFCRGSSLSLSSTVSTLTYYFLMFSTLRGTITRDFHPKRYDEHPRPFHVGFPPPLPSRVLAMGTMMMYNVYFT